jgi:hypothetical protein
MLPLSADGQMPIASVVSGHFRKKNTKTKTSMRTRNQIRQTLLITFVICFLISCTKPNSDLKSKNNKQENTELSVDTFKTIYPDRATNTNKNWTGDEDTLNLSLNNYDFTIYPGGLLKWGNSDSIRLSEDMYVTQSYFYVIENELLLFCEMSDSDNGTSDIFRINLTNKKIKWTSNLNGFNLGQPVIRANYGYITAIGSIGKLDLETGKYDYEKSNLYDRETNSFNNFDTILFRDSKTYFVAKRPLNSMVDTVIID